MGMEQRYYDYAKLILNHSLGLKPGERVLIQCDPMSVNFAEVVAQEVIRAGGQFEFWFCSHVAGATRLLEGNDDQLNYLSPVELLMSDMDCIVAIKAPHDYGFPTFDASKVAARRRFLKPLRDLMDRPRWVLALLPTQHLADQLGTSFSACEDLVFNATVGVDWQEITEGTDAIKRLFAGGSMVRIVSDGTDLRFSLGGRPAVQCNGKHNLPDGETFFCPDEHTVEGTVFFPDCQTTSTGTVSGLRLSFSQGVVTKAEAEKGHEILMGLLNADEGARRIGEFGIGTNPRVTKQTGDPLLDEKIGGTVHLALGKAYLEAGGTNDSSIHWDLILDLRKGGMVYVDGRLVCLDGVWICSAQDRVA